MRRYSPQPHGISYQIHSVTAFSLRGRNSKSARHLPPQGFLSYRIHILNLSGFGLILIVLGVLLSLTILASVWRGWSRSGWHTRLWKQSGVVSLRLESPTSTRPVSTWRAQPERKKCQSIDWREYPESANSLILTWMSGGGKFSAPSLTFW